MTPSTAKRSTIPVPNPAVPEGAPGSLALPPETPRPKPLGASETARLLLQRYAQATDEHASIELTRNARGDTQIKVAVRDPNPDAAAAEARRIYDSLALLYPMTPPKGAGDA